jgi:hypothetical protein
VRLIAEKQGNKHSLNGISHLPNFSSSKSDGDLLGLRQSIDKMPMLTVKQHRKSINISIKRTPTTARDTIATDEMFTLLSASPTATSTPRKNEK